jgi:hypothetical protein
VTKKSDYLNPNNPLYVGDLTATRIKTGKITLDSLGLKYETNPVEEEKQKTVEMIQAIDESIKQIREITLKLVRYKAQSPTVSNAENLLHTARGFLQNERDIKFNSVIQKNIPTTIDRSAEIIAKHKYSLIKAFLTNRKLTAVRNIKNDELIGLKEAKLIADKFFESCKKDDGDYTKIQVGGIFRGIMTYFEILNRSYGVLLSYYKNSDKNGAIVFVADRYVIHKTVATNFVNHVWKRFEELIPDKPQVTVTTAQKGWFEETPVQQIIENNIDTLRSFKKYGKKYEASIYLMRQYKIQLLTAKRICDNFWAEQEEE